MEDITTKKKNIVEFLLQRGVLIDDELLASLETVDNVETWYNSTYTSEENGTTLSASSPIPIIASVTHSSVEPSRSLEPSITPQIKIVKNFETLPKSWSIQDFIAHYMRRLTDIEAMLRNRTEMQGIMSIQRILQKKDKSQVALIGIVSDKSTTKNGNIIFTLEDATGKISVLVSPKKPELFEIAKELVNDEVIGCVGANSDKIVFASTIIIPDVPIQKELKKSEDEVYAIFLSDIHAGSKKFLSEELQKFVSWLNGDVGNDKQKEVAQKICYIFIAGDIVDGVGIYPNQENELQITDIYRQYEEAAKFIGQIPQRIRVILCPGNHDAVSLSEPQQPLPKNYAKPLWDLPNVTMVSNPSLVNIHSSETFSGFDVLMYHGYSFDYYVANVDAIRNAGGYDRADTIMRFLLRRRHLAPSHKSTLYFPDPEKDSLVIDIVPDFFITGHIHKCSVSNYRNITMICGSCWQSKTSFQEKVGHHPEPCRVPIVNLHTREVKILKFGD
jgi:DNA polymerase II small subunit